MGALECCKVESQFGATNDSWRWAGDGAPQGREHYELDPDRYSRNFHSHTAITDHARYTEGFPVDTSIHVWHYRIRFIRSSAYTFGANYNETVGVSSAEIWAAGEPVIYS